MAGCRQTASLVGWSTFFLSVRDKVKFSVIIFMDGHASHFDVAISSFCRKNNIILYIVFQRMQAM